MSEPVISVGEKLHIMTRRLFEADIRRHFAGEVTAVAADLIEVTGYTFIFNAGTTNYVKLPELRTRVFSPGQAGLIVNKIPRDVVVSNLDYRHINRRLTFTDGKSFALDVNEFGASA